MKIKLQAFFRKISCLFCHGISYVGDIDENV